MILHLSCAIAHDAFFNLTEIGWDFFAAGTPWIKIQLKNFVKSPKVQSQLIQTKDLVGSTLGYRQKNVEQENSRLSCTFMTTA